MASITTIPAQACCSSGAYLESCRIETDHGYCGSIRTGTALILERVPDQRNHSSHVNNTEAAYRAM